MSTPWDTLYDSWLGDLPGYQSLGDPTWLDLNSSVGFPDVAGLEAESAEPRGGHEAFCQPQCDNQGQAAAFGVPKFIGNLTAAYPPADLKTFSDVPSAGSISRRVSDSPQSAMSEQLSETPFEIKQGPRFSKDTNAVLKSWYEAHASHPYPSEEEKKDLATATGLNVGQISTWFANTRRRDKRRLRSVDSGTCSPIAMNSPRNASWKDMTPLDRWRNSPPDTEAAPLSAIADAVATGLERPRRQRRSLSAKASYCHSAGSSPSVASSSGASSGSSISSADSANTTGSFNRFYSGVHRRRRRIQKSRLSSGPRLNQDDAQRIYQCTFCTDRFKHKHDWTRHEKTLHLALDRWTCTPFGPVYVDPETQRPECAFCGIPDPSDDHHALHRYAECRDKLPATRTFYRKDHLLQHLRLVHGTNAFIPSMKLWRTEVTRLNSRCGFCNERFTLWADRNAHIAKHFREGTRMEEWRGCRGFHPSFSSLVQNAMPPYLIGMESKSVNPFSASRLHGTARGGDGAETPSAATSFEILTVRLGQFVALAQRKGETESLTDEALQREARRILYGDDDPWNQTPADHPDWLQLFKSGHGMLEDVDAAILCDHREHLESWDTELRLEWLEERGLPVVTMGTETAGEATCGPTEVWDGEGPAPVGITWALQSPECLAELRARLRLMQSSSLSPA